MDIRPNYLPSNPLQQSMLAINTPHLFPPQQQPPPSQLGQQQPSSAPSHMGMLPNGATPNPPLGMLSSAQPSPASNNYQLQLQQANQQRRQQQIHQQALSQGLTTPNPAGPPHVNGIAHNALPMSFPSNPLLPQNTLRRVPSQPLGQPPTSHLSGMHPNPPVVGAMPTMGGMTMNPQGSLPSQHVRPQQPIRMQQQPLPMQGPSHIAQDFLTRQTHLQNNVGLPSNMVRAASAQSLLGGLAQPSTVSQSHPGMMPPSMQNPPFQNAIPMSHSPPSSQLASSPRAPNAQGNLSSNLPPPGPGTPAQSGANRSRMTPDNAMFFQNSQMAHSIAHSSTRHPTGGTQFAFAQPSTPPGQLGNMSQPMVTGSIGTPSQQNRTALMATPAQAFERMNQGGEPFHSIPSRPPSQHAPSPHFPLPHPQPQQPPQTPAHSLHSSPQQPDHQMQGQRPQSQPQVMQPQSPRAAASRTPHTPQASLPNAGATLAASTRANPTLPGQSLGASPSSVQMPSTPTIPTQVSNRPSANNTSANVPVTPTSAPQVPDGVMLHSDPATQSSSVTPARPMLSNMFVLLS